ncbi:MAG: hypothetical protein NTY15_15525 [Planctomycetota bacterium]|nr:hypothetical protein [Planctomycetota bacterium]
MKTKVAEFVRIQNQLNSHESRYESWYCPYRLRARRKKEGGVALR